MYNADEKKAFEDMLAEIADSDEDEPPPRGAKGPGPTRHADSKPSASSAPRQDASAKPYAQSSHKMSKEDEAIENFGSDNHSTGASDQIHTTKRWLTRSCSANDRNSMRCFVERERSSFGMSTIYRCYLESDKRGDEEGGSFLMSACKRVANKTSYYLISLDPDAQDDRGSEMLLGKVRGNAIGSRYLITDHGLAPTKAVAPSMLRKELGVVSFEFDSGGPSRIEAWVPQVSSSGSAVTWQPDSEETGMEMHIDSTDSPPKERGAERGAGAWAEKASGGGGGRLIYLQNKAPKWDDAHGGHVLNFQGRVTESSVKNFQLCCMGADPDPDQVVLQFGRVGKHKFNMDLRHPLSPMQAFSICIACLDGKIADRKGYEYLRKFTSSASAEAAAMG
eukprot:CAMPEP_0173232172 /NCGR_PEP_ID=MMETSP1142-20121109/8815_1 /TAXON_ID=483371 /ORGANISM="non described non described, Strain CCMP2298" /LENGTH=391 /DNA_ID=CAMNT_0014161657 /DNA_START=129 /DNA_END=1301 /DNA_ORIENTATION=-